MKQKQTKKEVVTLHLLIDMLKQFETSNASDIKIVLIKKITEYNKSHASPLSIKKLKSLRDFHESSTAQNKDDMYRSLGRNTNGK